MSDEARVGIAGALGALVAKLVMSGRYLDYLRGRMAVPLAATAAVLLVSAGLAALLSTGGRAGVHPHGDRATAVGALLAIPIVLLATVSPAPLGAFAASRQSAEWRAPPPRTLMPPLPRAVDGAVSLSIADFTSRALYDPAASLKGVRVRLVGFVLPDRTASAGTYLLVRFAIVCCAADALAMRVRVHPAAGPSRAAPPQGRWIEVTGTWRPAPPLPPGPFDPSTLPTLDVITVRAIPQPADPYDGSV
jgi:uncharacterized repeat protein (TIGR03943 family)